MLLIFMTLCVAALIADRIGALDDDPPQPPRTYDHDEDWWIR